MPATASSRTCLRATNLDGLGHAARMAQAKSGMRRLENTLSSGKSWITCYGISGSATSAHADVPVL